MDFFNGIGFENFRVFDKSEYFKFAPITIITGTNNSGKSSLLNGIKLLQENFKHIKPAGFIYEQLDLESVMETVLDTGSLLERYGTLKQFVAKNSIEDEFSFSFQRKMSTINDEVEIKITVRVNENNIKDARIKLIEMRSIKSNTTIFKIEHNTNLDSQYHIKIDLIFFRQY